MADPIKRLNYFKHQFLRASDFIDEQKYHIQMRRQHNRSLHTWGIASGGLKVSFVQGATAVKVAEGMAVDSQGREIILTEDKTVELAGFAPGVPVFVTISYAERRTDPSSETGAEGDTRWTEEPQLRATPTKPSDVGTEIILARVNRSGTTVASVDEADRRAAGVETGELSVRTLRLSRSDVDAGAWPRLSCSAANQAALENGALKIDAHREIFFSDTGQIRSFDNNHRLVFNRLVNRLELHEFGEILFLTGAPAPTERMRIGAGGNVGIGRVAAAEKLEVQGNVRGMSLSFIDASGTPYPDNWLGMASNIEGTTRWLHVGGITDAGARRIMLAADRVFTNGRLGIGVTAPDAQLHITGGQWDVGNTEGDIKIGSAAHRLKIGVATGGAGAGDSRIRAHGGTNRLMLGSGGTDTLIISGANVGIGEANPTAGLEIERGATNNLALMLSSSGAGWGSGLQLKNTAAGGKHYGIYSGSDGGLHFGDVAKGVDRLIIDKDGQLGLGIADPKRMLHVQGSEIHSGGASGGFSFAERDNNGPFVDSGANGSRWVLYAAANTARLWTAGDKFIFDQKGSMMMVGNLTIGGALRVGGSDIYFTETDHDHTGSGNTMGHAAIENAKSHAALMILGRTISTNPHKRVVKLWDFLEVHGDVTVTGTLRAPSKQGFVVDDFINRHGDTLEQGDVVVISENQSSLYFGLKNNLPVPEVDIAQSAYDKRVCGIVNELLVQMQEGTAPSAPDQTPKKAGKGKAASKEAAPQPQVSPTQSFAPEELENLDSTKVGTGQFGLMVTHGAFAFCKVDADIAPVVVGDLLTTSPTKGHAQKVLDPSKAMGAVIGKSLGSLKKGKGIIPVIVTLQ